ncbi:MAG: hypothetical protein AB8I69_11645, partial [Anaerolineae bacterium]
MNRATRVVIDSLRGEALLGETVVAIADAGSSGELQVGGVRGPILRPLTFGERTRAVSRAALSPLPRENVCAGILDMATVQPGAANRAIQEILALILAGGDQEQAPSFAETVLLVARGTGWGPAQLADTPAAEIDRIAIHLGGRQRESSWNRLLLASSPADELASIRDDLADDLLKRVDIAPQAAEAGRDLAKTETFEHPIHSTDPSSNTGFASATTQPNHSNLAADASRVYTHMQNTIGANSELESDAAATEFEPEVLETTLSPQTSSLADSGRKTALLGKKPRHLPSSDLEGTAAPGKSSQCPLPPDNNRPVHFRIHNRVNPPSLPKTATSKPAD